MVLKHLLIESKHLLIMPKLTVVITLQTEVTSSLFLLSSSSSMVSISLDVKSQIQSRGPKEVVSNLPNLQAH